MMPKIIRFLTNKVSVILSTGLFIQVFLPQTQPFANYSQTQSLIEVFGASETPVYDFVYVDENTAGDVKLVGDIDLDGYPDLVVGGMPSEKLNWYRYPNWEKTVIATPTYEFTTDGALGDLDNDGDLDIVVPDGEFGNNILWFQNPLPAGNPQISSQWARNEIGSIGSWGKDVYLADFDKNGNLDVATRHASAVIIFFQTGPGSWDKVTFSGIDLGLEGMAVGDINGDGHQDLVLRGVWLRNPGGNSARTASNWSQYIIGTAHSEFKALVVDLNLDGKMDVLFSSSEGTADVDWWTPLTADPTGVWVRHIIAASLDKVHTLQAADMDLDGDIDIILAQMHTSVQKEIMVLYNQDGQAMVWTQQVIGNDGSHNSVVADIGSDGDFDIFGANWTGNPPVKLFINQVSPPNTLYLPLVTK